MKIFQSGFIRNHIHKPKVVFPINSCPASNVPRLSGMHAAVAVAVVMAMRWLLLRTGRCDRVVLLTFAARALLSRGGSP